MEPNKATVKKVPNVIMKPSKQLVAFSDSLLGHMSVKTFKIVNAKGSPIKNKKANRTIVFVGDRIRKMARIKPTQITFFIGLTSFVILVCKKYFSVSSYSFVTFITICNLFTIRANKIKGTANEKKRKNFKELTDL